MEHLVVKMTRQNFYILLIIGCVAILAFTVIKPQSNIQDMKCTKHFVMHPLLSDGRKLDIKVETRSCLLNKHVFKIGQEISIIIDKMPIIRTLESIPSYIADKLPADSILIIDKIWIRISEDN
jgi:predicted small integral membrane protein